MNTLSLSAFSCHVQVQCDSAEAAELFLANYGVMQERVNLPDLSYTVGNRGSSSSFFIRREKQRPIDAAGNGEFLYLFDKDVTSQLQRLRQDLYFVHAAALEFAGSAVLLVGKSKSGKSTTAWALLHQGFRYLSDDLVAIDPTTLRVYPYPRALWLRRQPSYPRRSPSRNIQTSWMLCVPPETFPCGVSNTASPLGAVFCVRYSPGAAKPSLRSMGKAEAAARLVASALNPGAHVENGLEMAVEIANRIPCHEVVTADLSATCNLILKRTRTALC